MSFPIKTCVVCGDEFELKPDKPGFANRCPDCSEQELSDKKAKESVDPEARKAEGEMNEARRKTIRDMLYSKDS